MITLKEHVGVVLAPSKQGFDGGAATFSCSFKEHDSKTHYVYYTGASDAQWTKAAIGLATSEDGKTFTKRGSKPLISVGKESVTPAVFATGGSYWMIFALKPNRFSGRRLGAAVAENLIGPWRFLKQVIKPELSWEENSIDAGPSIAEIGDGEFAAFYSNVSNKRFGGPLGFISDPAHWRRQIGMLKIKIRSDKLEAAKHEGNPLGHLNGEKGNWNESLFCPGYFTFGGKHFLLPSGSTYSTGAPYKQYIGLVEAASPFFEKPDSQRILIDGHNEKEALLPEAKGELALDTPSPLIKGNELWLYYAIMDRADGIWKTALSIFQLT